MAPLPKRKHTRSRSNIRKNSPSKRLRLPQVDYCPNCKKPKLPHVACPHCGFYK